MTKVSLLLLGALLCFSLNSFASDKPKQTGETMTKIETASNPAQKNLKEADHFLSENKKQPGIMSLPSGLQYKIVEEGQGRPPESSDFVVVDYQGRLLNGKEFDRSPPNQHVTFAVNAVIPGWTEALQLMKPGSRWTVYVPPKLAYGERSISPLIEANSLLVFDIHLISVRSALDANLNDNLDVEEGWEDLD